MPTVTRATLHHAARPVPAGATLGKMMNRHPFAADFKARPWWWEAAEPPARDTTLPERTRVAIVGGGYTGLSAALTLRRLGHEVVVLDAERIGWGASSRNGGMVSGGLKVARGPLEKNFGPERAAEIARACGASFPFIEETIAREGIDCDYVRCGRFVGAWTPRHFDTLARTLPRIQEISGHPARMVPRGEEGGFIATTHYHGGMFAEGAGSLHPGKYARGLAAAAERAGAHLVDQVRVAAAQPEGSGFRLHTSAGEMRADTVLMATNGYSRGGPMPWLTRRLLPVASYIIATEELGEARIERLFPRRRMISDTKRVLNYYRPSPDGKRILWGGRASFSPQSPEAAAPRLHAMMCAVLPELRDVKVTHAWTGNVAFTFDYLPHLGEEAGLHYAAGCQGSGVAMATWMGHNAALKMAGASNAGFALDGLPFPDRALYNGNPDWFLPMVGAWYRLRDRIDRIAA
ncbi:MAG TPA: FAD-binding oxidoreductase [Roseococcus sp.]|jgi:glycine/D-amino acid oxidase-like deaminating enzyme|nr:FAD-binding oxidoreductase [Roseococcus sp.]